MIGNSVKPKQKIELKEANLYASAYSEQPFKQVSGIFYIFNGKEMNNRYRISNDLNKIENDDPRASGYIHKSLIE